VPGTPQHRRCLARAASGAWQAGRLSRYVAIVGCLRVAEAIGRRITVLQVIPKGADVHSKWIALAAVTACLLAMVVARAQQENTKAILTAADYAEIQQLYAHYAFAYDSGATEEYVRLFTPDGVFIITDGETYKGSDRLAALARGDGKKNKFTLNHFTTNIAIDPSPEGAKGRAYLAVIQVRKGGERWIRSSGLYEDALVKTRDGWRFKTRLYTRLPDADGVFTPPTTQ